MSSPSETRNRQLRGSLTGLPNFHPIRDTPVFSGTVGVAVIHLTIAIRAARMQAQDALSIAIEALKNLGMPTIFQAAMLWIKSHPWESAALIVPVVLTACIPACLGFAGFTAGGIAAGSIAAGIQAGIGNVAAGSIFATLTSAAMSGYGMPIVFGGVWTISSVVCWGAAAWKRWKKDSDRADDACRGSNHTDGEGMKTIKLHTILSEE